MAAPSVPRAPTAPAPPFASPSRPPPRSEPPAGARPSGGPLPLRRGPRTIDKCSQMGRPVEAATTMPLPCSSQHLALLCGEIDRELRALVAAQAAGQLSERGFVEA